MKKLSIVSIALAVLVLAASCGDKVKYAGDSHLAIEDGKTVVERYGSISRQMSTHSLQI